MSVLRLAFSWLTVLPVRGPDAVDRRLAGRALTLTPVVGAVLGAIAVALAWLLVTAELPPVLIGLLVVAALALLTRGMHIDGTADTADGLGCYGDAARAREVMHSGSTGPFGVAAIVVVIGAQAAAFGALGVAGHWYAIALAVVAGRVAAVLACRRGVPAATDRGFGALVAETQPTWSVVAWAIALTAASVPALDRWWQGPVVVVVALLAATLLVRHCVRRFDGLNGDVLGAAIELTVTVVAIGATISA